MEKQISIIIATYNAAGTLKNCLDSIIPQLTEECELLIIDGGSTDRTNAIIQAYHDNIAYAISEPDKGIYDAWNKGVKAAKGDWIAFIGADDMLLPDAINEYLKVLRNTPNIDSYDYICAHNEYVDMNGNLLKILGDKPEWATMRRKMVVAHVGSLHSKKNLFETIGFYDYEHFHICADYELLMRKKDKLKCIMLNCHIAQMKVGGISFSSKAVIETYRIRRTYHSLPFLLNELQFLRDWIAFKLFKFRKIVINSKFSICL